MNEASRLLRAAWQCSFARLARPGLAPPRAIALDTPISRPVSYAWAAMRTAAPVSTACMALATFAATFCNVALSFALGRVTERALAAEPAGVTTMIAVLLALWLAIPMWQVLDCIGRLFASQNLRIAVTDHLSARIMYARPLELARAPLGNLVERIEIAAASLPAVVGSVAETLVKLGSVALLTGALLIGVSVPLALLAACWLVSAVALSAYLAYSGMQIVEDASDAHAGVIAQLVEAVANVALIRGFVAQRAERARLGVALTGDLTACRRVRSYWVFVLLIETAYKWLFGLAMVLAALALYQRGALPLPALVTVGALVISLSWHFESVAFHFVDLFESIGNLRASLRELAAVPIDLPRDGAVALPSPGSVRLAGVSAGHGEAIVLHDVSLAIMPGEKIGLVGPSGAGKSTLLSLLRGELGAAHGTIELHGVPISRLTSEAIAEASTEASQAAPVFNRSVRDNVGYGMATVDPVALDRALELAQASALVGSLARGLDTPIGERGASLSTGERQRLAIARALLKRAPLVIFDEATSSIDAISEARILAHVLALPDCTAIVVSHRVATLAGCDRIVVLERGRVVDVGTHAELFVRSRLYQQLHYADAVIAQGG